MTLANLLTSPRAASDCKEAKREAIDASAITVIEPTPGWHLINLRELWHYRELLLILMWRDIQVRYKQTVLGAAWAVIPPLANMAAFSLFIGRVVGPIPAGLPYPLFAFAGFLPWFFFANSITSASQSVVTNQSLVTKVYFPRLLIPFAAIGPHLLDFVIGFGLLLLMMFAYGVMPTWGILLAPVMLLCLAVAAVGIGTLLAALTVSYRDFRHVVPFLVQFWMVATPSIYLVADAVGPRGTLIMPLNPAYGLIANFRAAMLGSGFDHYSFAVSAAVAGLALLIGCFYFRSVDRSFADVI